jgi:general secretion pathway protein I
VLVALFIVSLTLISAFKASASLTQSAARQNSNFLAQLCVDNYLSDLRLSALLPGTGSSEVTCQQNNHTFSVHILIDVTPNPSFRRVEAQVFEQNTPVLKITTVVGLL